MSARTAVSISGHQTGAPVALAIGATAPMWSKWVWVRRIPSIVRLSSSVAPRILSASSPGSTISACSDPSWRNTKQFSAIWPTVNMRTSMGSALGFADAVTLRLALLPLLRFLAEVALVHVAVQQVGHRDVEGDPERDGGQQGLNRVLADHREDDQEDGRSQASLLDRAGP